MWPEMGTKVDIKTNAQAKECITHHGEGLQKAISQTGIVKVNYRKSDRHSVWVGVRKGLARNAYRAIACDQGKGGFWI